MRIRNAQQIIIYYRQLPVTDQTFIDQSWFRAGVYKSLNRKLTTKFERGTNDDGDGSALRYQCT